MRSSFAEWYGPTDEEIEYFLTEATIALDANVLLALYRVGGPQRIELLKVLSAVADRLWVPYQAALEYQKNRLAVAARQQKIYDTIVTLATKRFDEAIDTALSTLKDLSGQAVSGLRDKEISSVIVRGFDTTAERIREVANSRRDEMTAEFKQLRDLHAVDFSTVQSNDPIRAELDILLTPQRLGEKPAPDIEKERRERARQRVLDEVPPGYKDAQKSDPTGDGMIWLELLEHAKKTERPILFVTDDVKEDSYERISGKTIGPRVEMRAEMLQYANQSYHQTTVDRFLELAGTFLKVEVSEDTIDQYRSSRLRMDARLSPRADGDDLEAPTISPDHLRNLEQELADLQAERRSARTTRKEEVDPIHDESQFRIAELLEQELAELQAERRRARTTRHRKTSRSPRSAYQENAEEFAKRRQKAREEFESGRPELAVEELKRLLDVEHRGMPSGDLGYVETVSLLVIVYLHLGHLKEAWNHASSLFTSLSGSIGPGATLTLDALDLMETVKNRLLEDPT
ncbi:PIN-like domain-containing protein [Nocardia takedensis]